jgi:hypothetical protein
MKPQNNNNGRSRKVRSDSALGRLAAEKQETLKRWLLEDNLSYREVRRRLEEEFGVKTAENSLAAYYRRLAVEGRFAKMANAMRYAKDFVIGYQSVESLERAVTQMSSLAAYEMSLEPAERVRVEDISRLMKVVTQSQRHRLEEKRYELAKKRMETYAIMAMGRYNEELRSKPTRESTKQAIRMANEMLAGKVPRFDDEIEEDEAEAETETETKRPTAEAGAATGEEKKPEGTGEAPSSTS